MQPVEQSWSTASKVEVGHVLKFKCSWSIALAITAEQLIAESVAGVDVRAYFELWFAVLRC